MDYGKTHAKKKRLPILTAPNQYLEMKDTINYQIISMLRFTKLVNASPFNILFCNKARSISW